jgi:hypothetical protein
MQIFGQKALNSPKFVRVGISTCLIAALAITGIAYSRRHPSDSSGAKRSMLNLVGQDPQDLRSVQVAISDPLILEAAEEIRAAFNVERNKSCSSKSLYEVQGEIQYARKKVASNGTVVYSLEVEFDDEVVFAHVAKLTSNVGIRFQVTFSTPSPCDDGIQNQLAVSALGKSIM